MSVRVEVGRWEGGFRSSTVEAGGLVAPAGAEEGVGWPFETCLQVSHIRCKITVLRT